MKGPNIVGLLSVLSIPLHLSLVQGSPFYSGSVSAQWSDPIQIGSFYDGLTGSPQIFSSSQFGACNLSGCTNLYSGVPSNEVVYGSCDGCPPGPPPSSAVTFTGRTFSHVASNEVFDLGRISFQNGTSLGYANNQTTTIFGATVTLSFTMTSGAQVDPFIVAVPFAGTINDGTAAQNADWIGPFGTLRSSLNAYEGATVNAELYGEIVGDPVMMLAGLVLDAGQDANGFIGDGLPVQVPEPGSMALLSAGLAGLLSVRRRK